MTVVGTAEVVVTANGAGFEDSLKATTDPAFAEVRDQAALTGDAIGKDLGKGADDAAEKSEGGFSKLKGLAVGAVLALSGTVVELGKKGVEAATDDQNAAALLGVAFKNAGYNVGAYKGSIDATIASMAKYGYSSADVQNALAKLTTATKSPTLAMKDLTVAANIAAAEHIPLATATQLVQKAAEGNTAALTRMGLASAATAKTMSGDPVAIMNLLTQKFGGAAAAASQTFGGAMAGLKATVTNSLSDVASKILPVVTQIIPTITPVLTTLATMIGSVLQQIAPIVAQVVPIVTQLATVFSGVLSQALSVVAPVFVTLVKNISPLLPIVGQVASLILGVMSSAFKAILPTITEVVKIASALATEMISELQPAFAAIVSIAQVLLPPIGNLVQALAGPFLAIVTALVPPMTAIVNVVAQVAGSLATALAPVITALVPVITSLAAIVAQQAATFGALLKALTPLLPPLALLLTALLPILPVIASLVSLLLSGLNPILKVASGIITDLVKDAIVPLVTILTGGLAAAVRGIVGIFTTSFGSVKNIVGDALTFFETLPDKIMGFLSKLPEDFLNLGKDLVKDLISGLGDLEHDVGGAIKSGLEHIPVVGHLFSALASGGVVTKPTLALVGEAGPEAVIPLNQLAGGANALAGGGISPLRLAASSTSSSVASSVTDRSISIGEVNLGSDTSPASLSRELGWLGAVA